jgi:predicted lipoprotein
MTQRAIALAAVALLAVASAHTARAEVDHGALARGALEAYIRPGYARFAEAASALDRATEALCKNPSPAALDDDRGAFAAAVEAWSHVEPIRFGPAAKERRFERLFYWPDPKGVGGRQVREALAKKDASVTDPATLAGKSVALQGLPALEDLLYGDGSDGLAAPGGDAVFRCRFAAAIAENVDSLGREIVAAWADGAPDLEAYLEPGGANGTYRSAKEVSLDLFKTLTAGIEWVRDQKLGKPLGANPDEARPKLAPFSRSGSSFRNMAGNLEGARDLFKAAGFDQIVHTESAGVEDSIVFDLNHAIEVLRGMKIPVAEAVRSEKERAKLEALRVSLKSAAGTAGEMIASGADLSFGFNAMDGD